MRTMIDPRLRARFVRRAFVLLPILALVSSISHVDLIEAALNGVAASNSSNSSDHFQEPTQATGSPALPIFRQPPQQLNKCAQRATCANAATASNTGFGLTKPACFCDPSCALYDDCCHDAPRAEPLAKRLELGPARLRARRREWLCRRMDPNLPGIYVRATCPAGWLEKQGARNEVARMVQERCASAASVPRRDQESDGGPQSAAWLHADPLGSLMPITDMADGITYANSYCLRCNSMQPATNRRKLIYWSPVVSCNYNIDSDDRNALFDLISAKGGRALAFSRRHNRWIIKMPPSTQAPSLMGPAGSGVQGRLVPGQNEGEDEPGVDRVCSVSPRAPDSIGRIMRHCRPRTVDSCPATNNWRPANETATTEELRQAQRECQSGHQALVYSQTRDLAYYNQACARCNLELQTACEPRLSKQTAQTFSIFSVSRFSSPTSETPAGPGRSLPDDSLDGGLEIGSARNQGGDFEPDGSLSGSFSVLMDLYGGLQGGESDEQVGLVHRCEDAERQVYDPFLLTCRDIICGPNYRFDDGACVQANSTQPAAATNATTTTKSSILQLRTSTPSGRNDVDDNHADENGQTGGAPKLPIAATPVRVNGKTLVGVDKRTTSSSGQRGESGRLVAPESSTTKTPAGGQRAATQQPLGVSERVERDDHGQEEANATRTSAETRATSSAAATPTGSSLEALRDANPFVALFVELKAAPPPPQTGAHRPFAECGKILIEPEHYRLFNTSELSSSSISSEWLAARENPTRWEHADQHAAWALVAPYNLTLAPGQFRPARVEGRAQLGLHICSPFKSDLVAKFKPAMVYLTTCCLVVSIASLVFYLLLHCLSTFDLRHLVVELAQAGQVKDSLRRNALNSPFRDSRASTETSYNAVRSQSLSSRGVACLAAALLAAYLLFVLGHQHQSLATGPGSGGCALIAAATYGSFLLAFNWMFLLSYDIWRTLRLATCRLRPTVGSQTCRFLVYAAVAILAASSMASLALLTDQLGQSFECANAQQATRTSANDSQSQHQDRDQANSTASCASLSQHFENLELLVQTYRPKFGQRAGSCWFANRRSLALFFGLPVTLIMLVNLLFFLHSSFMVIKTSSRSSRRLKPTSSTWSQASADQAADFAQQNGLTTSSISSVQTIQSSISAGSSNSSEPDTPEVCQLESLEAAGQIQSAIDEASRRLSERRQSRDTTTTFGAHGLGKRAPPLAQLKQAGFSNSFASAGQISSTDQLPASSLAHKCDLRLSSLGALMSSLAKDYRLYCRLSTIMGLTWITGLAASLVDQSDALWYLFVVLNSLQGLFIFVAFGLKRSRLTNLRILFAYMDHALKRKLRDKNQSHDSRA